MEGMNELLYILSGVGLGVSLCSLLCSRKLNRQEAVFQVCKDTLEEIMQIKDEAFLKLKKLYDEADKCVTLLNKDLKSEREAYKALKAHADLTHKYMESLEKQLNEKSETD